MQQSRFVVLLILIVGINAQQSQSAPTPPLGNQRLLQELECTLDPAFQQRIQKDLAPFSAGIPPSMIEKAKNQEQIIIVSVRNKQVFISRGPMRVAWKLFFLSLGPLLPDMEFVLNNFDEPRVLKRRCSQNQDWKSCSCDKDYQIPQHGYFLKPCNFKPIRDLIPLFSSGTLPACFSDILIPSLAHVAAHHIYSNVTWKDKQFKAIWRGSDTGGHNGASWCSNIYWAPQNVHYSQYHRQRLISLCSKTKDCDARFSKYLNCAPNVCAQMRNQYGPKSCIPLESQAINKLFIDIDGYSYSERFPKLLATGSVVIKIAAFLDIGFVPAKPWVHYIPVKMDLSDFQKNLNWARQNDKELQKIGIRAKELAQKTLQIKHYRCYTVSLLKRYANLLVSERQYLTNLQNNKQKTLN